MNEHIKKVSISTLDRVIQILNVKEDKDILELKELSNSTIHNASVFQDDVSVSIAVVIYALSKIMERNPDELDYNKILKMLANSRDSLERGSDNDFSVAMERLISEISKMDARLKLYTQEVITESQVKKGCKLCEIGLSTAQASEVMGISQWDMMKYLGNTKLNEHSAGIDLKSRMKFARSLFP